MHVDLRNLMLADAALGATAPGGVHWGESPQGGDWPVVILNRISDVVTYHMQGASALRRARVQADILAETMPQMVAAADALDAVVSGYRGTVGGTVFAGIFIDTRREWRAGESNEVGRTVRATIDLIINYKEV